MTACECGQPIEVDCVIYNGRDYLEVCRACYLKPENVILEACVDFAMRMTAWPAEDRVLRLDECLRYELAYRGQEWTEELQAACDAAYLEWYLEPA